MCTQPTPLIDREASFASFVYPFLFEPKEFDKRVQKVDEAKRQGRKGDKKIWNQADFLKDVLKDDHDLLNHVFNYLNPNPANGSPPAARLWKFNNDVSNHFGFSSQWYWQLKWGKDSHSNSFKFGEKGKGDNPVQLALFRVGVGFVTVFAKPQSEQEKDWLDFLHYFRFIRGQQGVKMQGKRSTGATTEET